MDSYERLLVARYRPELHCLAPHGSVLTLLPKSPPITSGIVDFRDASNSRLKSRYGWVVEVPAYTLDDFIYYYLAGSQLPPRELQALRALLGGIAHARGGEAFEAAYRLHTGPEAGYRLGVYRARLPHPPAQPQPSNAMYPR
jgi:hypothetical protein